LIWTLAYITIGKTRQRKTLSTAYN